MWWILRSAGTLQAISLIYSGGGASAPRHSMTAARTAAHLAHSELTGRILGMLYMGDPYNSLPLVRQSTEQLADGDSAAEQP
jgi:hypothetical protein